MIMHISDIDLVGQLADLKDTDSKNTLAITVLLELFIKKGLCTREDFAREATELERLTTAEIAKKRRHEILHII